MFTAAWVTTSIFLALSACNGYLITKNANDVLNRTYSYIIVGGGTAGLTIANRLTEDKHTTVLVIEAGREVRTDPRVTDPAYFGIADYSDLTWGYKNTNQSLGGRMGDYKIGKALGGSSSINGMQWTRGNAEQYDAIEQLGNPGWNFASFQSYIKKSESFHVPTSDQISFGVSYIPTAHGLAGHVDTGFPNPYPCPLCKLWDTLVDAFVTVFPTLRSEGVDQCSGNPNGVARCIFSILPGPSTGPNAGHNRRSSSTQSYIYSLQPEERPNLFILVEHHASRIVWAPKNSATLPKPTGVEFFPEGDLSSMYVANITKEVIVSAGSVNTPKFLELSGVGNQTLLEGFGIPVTVDLPSVGTNLQDQAGSLTAVNTTLQLNNTEYHAPGSGVSAFVTLPQLLGRDRAKTFVQELRSTLKQRAAKIVAEGAAVSQAGVEKMLELQAKQYGEQESAVAELVNVGLPAAFIVLTSAWPLLPQSRGTIHVSSPNPLDPPAINPNYLGSSFDFELLVNLTIAANHIYNQSSVKDFYSQQIFPGPAVQTDEEFAAYVRNSYSGVSHPLGTASMMPRELGGVVDSHLRVYGVQGVRVADASILPLQISAHPSSTVYGIAEKAADLIKQG